MTAPRVYAFDNDSGHAVAHHDALTQVLDGYTTQQVTELVDLDGARCLEVAAGGGGFALWLAERVGPNGSVLATDLKPGRIPSHPRLEIRQHDITSDPLDGGYDLVHARALLNHLPQRRAVLSRLAAAVRPGGVLLVEDFDPLPGPDIVAYAPTAEATALLAKYQDAHERVLNSHARDRNWSRSAFRAMTEEGLTEVDSVVFGRVWRGGGPGLQLLRAGLEQLADELIAAGLTVEELDQVRVLFSDPRVALHGHRLYSTSGRKP